MRRLGYLLELAGHTPHAEALRPLACKAKTAALLNPSVKPLVGLSALDEKAPGWQLILNESVEVDF